jgi:hypothetical protein
MNLLIVDGKEAVRHPVGRQRFALAWQIAQKWLLVPPGSSAMLALDPHREPPGLCSDPGLAPG